MVGHCGWYQHRCRWLREGGEAALRARLVRQLTGLGAPSRGRELIVDCQTSAKSST
jgi:hypothetical protein